jgi:DNA-binding NarL/FixJ family response regulator
MISSVLNEFSHMSFSDSDKINLLQKLSPREREVLREMDKNDTNLEIAHRLFISENTVKHHIRNILTKLEVKNRRQAILIARQNGFDNQS